MKTLQEIFDTAIERLLAQGEKAESGGGVYNYINDAGLRCGVGVLLPERLTAKDTLYLRNSIGVIYVREALKPFLMEEGISIEDRPTYVLLEDLQKVHDNYPPVNWLEQANYLAKKHGLTAYEPKTTCN